MNYSFIDYENLTTKKLLDLEFNESDIVYIFYTNINTLIDMDALEHITHNEAVIKFYHVENGIKDALDFQLSTMLGYLIGINGEANSNNTYTIYSEDKGYDKVVNFWKTRYNINISREYKHRRKLIEKMSSKKDSALDDTLYISLEDLESYNLKDYAYSIAEICNRCVTKEQIHNEIEFICRNSKESAYLYNQIKPLLIERGYA